MDKIIKCSKCQQVISDDNIYCTHCGTHKPISPENYCTNEKCICCRKGILFDEKVMYCGQCGQATTLGKKVEAML